jgi:RimJ/RimL family protein N-acetyltransferase
MREQALESQRSPELATLLPERLVKLRPMRPEDATLVAHWISAGREEHSFRAGGYVDPESVVRYQESMSVGRQYFCVIVEADATPIGYMDYCIAGGSSEVLGIYLEPGSRGRRFGRHLLRWLIADVRERACDRIELQIYRENLASLRAAEAAGFQPASGGACDEDGRVVERMVRPVKPFRRFSPWDSLFGALRGENIFLHHVALAESLADWFVAIPGVEIVLGLGSLSHGFADWDSDLDLAILCRGGTVDERLWIGERWMAGLCVDLSVVDFELSPPLSWDRGRRQAFHEGVILHGDGDLAWLKDHVKLSSAERSARMVELLLEMGWIGFQPSAWSGREVHGYRWAASHDLWLRRGCLAAAQAAVDQALEAAIQLIYYLNWRHPPHPKWRRFLVLGLPWLPEGFNDLIAAAEARSPDERNFHDRSAAIFLMVTAIADELERTGQFTNDIYRRFLVAQTSY